MKLDHDCVRDLMLEIEEKHVLNVPIFIESFNSFKTTTKYGFPETYYALVKLKEAKFVILRDKHDAQGTHIEFKLDGLTFEGHQYLDNIRDSKIWKTTKTITSKVSSVSLSAMGDIAQTQLM